MFENFTLETVSVAAGSLRVLHGGSGPPILLLHGHPRTHATWWQVAECLSSTYTVVCPDLPGFGQSYIPHGTADHSGSSKRAKALALVEMMAALGHERFAVVGHDRGSYTAFRMAMDHPEQVGRLVVLDSVPIIEALERADEKFARLWWHWFLFGQPDKPERAILADPMHGTAARRSLWARRTTRTSGRRHAIHTWCMECARTIVLASASTSNTTWPTAMPAGELSARCVACGRSSTILRNCMATSWVSEEIGRGMSVAMQSRPGITWLKRHLTSCHKYSPRFLMAPVMRKKETEMDIVAAGPSDDQVLIERYLAIWDSYGTPTEDYADDAMQAIARFIEESRIDGRHGGFLAVIDGKIAGSAMCCSLRSQYPEVIKPQLRRRGYIWSVYTLPAQREKGIGKALTQRALSHLKGAGCTHVVLHASEARAPLYEMIKNNYEPVDR